MKELKPCPFCGNKDIKIENKGSFYIVYCFMCDVTKEVCGDECASQRQDAIDQWNRRAFIGKLLSKEEIENALLKIMKRKELTLFQEDFCFVCGEPVSEEKRKLLVNHLSTEVHKAQQDKQEG